jgi:hypothetical protein
MDGRTLCLAGVESAPSVLGAQERATATRKERQERGCWRQET